MKDNNKLNRYIFDIIRTTKVIEQRDLQNILKKNGYEVPIATLNRRLKKLNIAKIGGIYKVTSLYQDNLPLILNMQISEFGIIILHTNPGQANSLAYFLDQKYVNYSYNEQSTSGILGTIAGDDTVLVIIKSQNVLEDVLVEIYKCFPYLKIDEIENLELDKS